MIKTHKKKKSKNMRGKNMGTHGGGARKKRKGSGHRGGVGMSGSGKRADHKKTLVTKLFGNSYFGKQGITSKKTKINKQSKINLREIESNLHNYLKKGVAKKKDKSYEIDLSKNKILGDGEVKEKLIIKAQSASKSAIEKVKKSGGEIIIVSKNVSSSKNLTPKKVSNLKEAKEDES